MEIIKDIDIDNKCYLTSITGNMRFRILNDFYDGLINDSLISIKHHLEPTIYLNVYDKYNILKNMPKKMYASFDYKYGKPIISSIWDFNDYTPYFIIYPVFNIHQSIYTHFNLDLIKNKITFNMEEADKNVQYIDMVYFTHLDV